MSKTSKRIYEEVAELEQYVAANEEKLKRLRDECETAENISKTFINYIKEKKKEIFILKKETWVPLPKELADKKAIINMQNKDNKCFLWCVLRGLNPKDNHPERVDKDLKLKENTLNMEGIEYPVSLKDIDKFENQNQTICIKLVYLHLSDLLLFGFGLFGLLSL